MIRRKRKFRYTVLELTDLGSGKMGIQTTVGGWFKSKKILFGYWDLAGEEKLEVKDKRIIQDASSEDFHEINGRRGIVVYRSPTDPMILLPISKMHVENEELLLEIAPSDYRDASVNIIERTQNETLSKWEKMAPYVTFGFMGIIFFISIILIVQMVKHGQAEASKLILDAGKLAVEAGTHAVVPTGGAP
jgi:hypothetical protein